MEKNYLILVLSSIIFQSCGPTFTSVSIQDLKSSQSMAPSTDGEGFLTSPGITSAPQTYKTELRYLNGEQVFHSLLSLTGLSWDGNLAYIGSSGYQTALTYNPELSGLTPSYVVQNTNLVLNVCKTLITKEYKIADRNQRNFLKGVNSSIPLDLNSDVAVVANRFAFNLWGKDLTDEQLKLIQDHYTEFISQGSNGDRNQSAMAYYQVLCTAMLGSIETMTY